VGNLRFAKLAQIMLALLTIPHSNAACERVFSQVRKNKTAQRDSLSASTLNSLLVLKGRPGKFDPGKKYTESEIKRLKSCYTEVVQERSGY